MAGNPVLAVSLNPSLDLTREVDRFVFGDICRVRASYAHPGGKGLNVCRMVSRLGGDCRALAFLGGRTGAEVATRLAREKVPCTVVPIRAETRTIYNFTERRGKRILRINDPGPRVSAREWKRFLTVLLREVRRAEGIVCLSGSIPAGLPSTSYRTIIDLLKDTRALVALDTDAGWMRGAIGAGPAIIKPNLWELQRLVGRTVRTGRDVEKACRGLLKKGIRMVLLTLGGNGALLFSSQDMMAAVPPRVAVRCPVGCGDAFLGGFLFALSRGRALDDCLALATACGAAKAQCAGTAMPSLSSVRSLLPRVRVRRVENVPAGMVRSAR